MRKHAVLGFSIHMRFPDSKPSHILETMKSPLLILSSVVLFVSVRISARCLDAAATVNFERIIGMRPSSEYVDTFLLHKSKNGRPVTIECVTKCRANSDCQGFVIDFDASECRWYKESSSPPRNDVIDRNVVWFKKICLDEGDLGSCKKLWAFDIIPGATLIGNDIERSMRPMSGSECRESCLSERNFECRSAKFRLTDRQSRMGICTLSDTDRRLTPSSFRVSDYEDEYYENQCSIERANEFCAYEEYEDVTSKQIDVSIEKKTKDECEKLCDSMTTFKCRGYTLSDFSMQRERFTCSIHATDSKIHGPTFFKTVANSKYFEKANCLNVTVTCTDERIIVRYQPEIDRFDGKIYLSGYSERKECYSLGDGNNDPLLLNVSIFDNRCGIDPAVSPQQHFDRTLFSGSLVLQYNRLIQTQADRSIRVGCIFGNESKIVLGTGVNIASSSTRHQGTTILNSTLIRPMVRMKIVDLATDKEVIDTEIGQELQLLIELEPSPDATGDFPVSYDIRAGHLVAMTENGQDSILLLDDGGCPTNLHVFPSLTKIYADQSVVGLRGNFRAFKFTDTSIVRFSITVSFCENRCAPVDCARSNPITRRRKRVIETVTIQSVNKEEFDDIAPIDMRFPLELILLVRSTKKASYDRLVANETPKILVAGYDFISDQVCIDYFLVVAMITTWTSIQVVIVVLSVLMVKRYKNYYRRETLTQSLEELHKNFGLGITNLEPRRVHWADFT